MSTKPPVWPYNKKDEGENKVKSSDYKDLKNDDNSEKEEK